MPGAHRISEGEGLLTLIADIKRHVGNAVEKGLDLNAADKESVPDHIKRLEALSLAHRKAEVLDRLAMMAITSSWSMAQHPIPGTTPSTVVR